jgi:hypothetical protein
VNLLAGSVIDPVQFVGQETADRDHQIGVVAARRFGVANPTGEAIEKHVAVAAVLGRMHGQDARRAETVHRVLHGVGGQPVVGVDDLEPPDHGSHFVKAMGHGFANVVHAFDIVFARAVIDAVVVNPVDAVIVVLVFLAPGDDVRIVPAPLQAGGQFRDVDAETAGRDRVLRFRRKHGDTHWFDSIDDPAERVFCHGRAGTRAFVQIEGREHRPEATSIIALKRDINFCCAAISNMRFADDK